MAFNETEVEVKVPVDQSDYLRLRRELPRVASLDGRQEQVDCYFSPREHSYLDVPFPYEWLSVRERAGKVLLNYKHFYPEGAEHHTHCREIEVEVAAAGPAVRLLEALGFELVVTVRKVREQYRVDGFEIGLDEVDGLGRFVEIEALHDHGGIAKTRAAVEALSHQLGVDLSRTDPRGYPYRLLRAKGLL